MIVEILNKVFPVQKHYFVFNNKANVIIKLSFSEVSYSLFKGNQDEFHIHYDKNHKIIGITIFDFQEYGYQKWLSNNIRKKLPKKLQKEADLLLKDFKI